MKVQSQFIEMFGTLDEPKVEVKKLIDVVLSSGQYGSNTSATDYQEGKPRYIRITDINDDGSLNDDIKTAEVIEDKYKLIPGDIVFARTGATVGKTYMHETGNAIYAGYLIKYQMNESRMKPAFMKALTHSKTYYNWVANSQKIGAQPNISADQYDKMPVLVPQIEKQEEFLTIYQQADKSKFVGFKSQFIEMFAFQDLSLTNPSDDFGKKCYDDTSSATKVPAGDYQNKGRYAIYDQSQDCDIAGYTDSIEGVCNNYPAVLFGDHSRVIKYINQPFYIGADGVKIIRPKEDDLLPEFLYYDLLYHNIPNTGYNRHFKYVKMFKLTEVSIDEQKEFLKIAHQADKSKYYYQIA